MCIVGGDVLALRQQTGIGRVGALVGNGTEDLGTGQDDRAKEHPFDGG
jgi:hypothetical protein